MRLLSDNPASKDTLGLGPTADLLSNVILGATPPFTIGLFGEWGSGKTTLMKMVSGRINASGRKTVWFNAWKYDGKEVIWNALIQAVFYAMRNDPDITHDKDRHDFLERVGRVAVELAKYAAGEPNHEAGDLLRKSFIDVKVEDEHPIDPVWDLLSKFFLHAARLGIAVSSKTDSLFLEETRVRERKELNFYQMLSTFLRIDTRRQIEHLVFCLEDVRNIKQIISAAEAFGADAILICTTSLDQVARDFSFEAERGKFNTIQLDLTSLAPNDVINLLKQRWATFGAVRDAELPIRKEVIEQSFVSQWN
jgi:energy-coupling factor transporter ATP-binding protein EcfA2